MVINLRQSIFKGEGHMTGFGQGGIQGTQSVLQT